MIAQPYWINSQLAIVPRPRGAERLDGEVQALREAGIDVLVSMIEDLEATDLGLEREEAAAKQAGLRFIHFPIPDHRTPSDRNKFVEFLIDIERDLANGKRVGIHCLGCIGRSSVVAASLLIRSGLSAREAWIQIETARSFPVPDTREQLEWVEQNIRPLP